MLLTLIVILIVILLLLLTVTLIAILVICDNHSDSLSDLHRDLHSDLNPIPEGLLSLPLLAGEGKNSCATYSGHIFLISSWIRVVSRANVNST